MTKQWELSGNAENVDWNDIAMAGRAYADNLIGEPGISAYMHIMADEIERLRGYRSQAESDAAIARLLADRLRLTDAEREAVEWAAHAAADPTPVAWYAPQIAATLRGLLERTQP